MCGHTPGKVAGRQETVKAEMNGLTPGLDRSLARLALLLPVRDGKTRWKTRLKMVDKSIGCVLYCAKV